MKYFLNRTHMNPVGHIINSLSNRKDWIIGHTILDVFDNVATAWGSCVVEWNTIRRLL